MAASLVAEGRPARTTYPCWPIGWILIQGSGAFTIAGPRVSVGYADVAALPEMATNVRAAGTADESREELINY